MFIYHWTRASLHSLPINRSGDIFTMSDAEFMEESHTQNNMPGAYPEEQAPFVMAPTTAESNQTPFNMSDIMALDQASTALENNRPDLPFAMSDIRSLSDAPAAAVNDVPGERGSVAQSVPGDVADESWIPIPYVSNPNEPTQHRVTNAILATQLTISWLRSRSLALARSSSSRRTSCAASQATLGLRSPAASWRPGRTRSRSMSAPICSRSSTTGSNRAI